MLLKHTNHVNKKINNVIAGTVEFDQAVVNLQQPTDGQGPVTVQRVRASDKQPLPDVQARLVIVANGYRSALRASVCDQGID